MSTARLMRGIRQDHPLLYGLDWWFIGQDDTRGHLWANLGWRDGVGTLTNFASPPASNSWWSMRYPRLGRSVNSLAMDNTNDYVALPSGDILTNGVPFTIAWWEYLFSTAQTFPTRFSLAYNAGVSAFLIFRSSNAGYLPIWYGPGGGAGLVCSTAPTLASSVGIWTHFCLVNTAGPNNTTAGNSTLYVNGVANSSSGGSTAGAGLSNRFGGYSANFANAAMDDVAIWPARALTAQEAREWYRSSTLGHPEILPAQPLPMMEIAAVVSDRLNPLLRAQAPSIHQVVYQ